MKKALFFETLSDNSLRCFLCRHRCFIKDNELGFCGVRFNRKGLLYTYTYGNISALACDPIEKKPLYHFLPGTNSYSLSSFGCNFRCGFCQNSEIASSFKLDLNNLDYQEVSAKDIVSMANKHHSKSISYTYNEPTLFYEFALDVSKIAQVQGVKNVFVTNGFINDKPLLLIRPFLDAANIDLKSFSESFYRKNCQAELKEVLDSIILFKKIGVWIEITTLVIPGFNDNSKELSEIAKFIANLDVNIPWHISRFFPHYNFSKVPITPEPILDMAFDIAKEKGLNFVYIGNAGFCSDTLCPECKYLLIQRKGYEIKINNLSDGYCPKCNAKLSGVWS